MKPVGWRRKRRREQFRERVRRELSTAVQERLLPSDAERTVHFANSSWEQLEEIAANRGVSVRHALAEAIAVWQQMSREVKTGDYLRFTVGSTTAGRESQLLMIRRYPEARVEKCPRTGA